MGTTKWPLRQEAYPSLLRGNRRSTCGHLYVTKAGYFTTTDRQHKASALHRAYWEAKHGAIPAGCYVHHVNFDKSDNHIENLACLTPKEHIWAHRRSARAAD